MLLSFTPSSHVSSDLFIVRARQGLSVLYPATLAKARELVSLRLREENGWQIPGVKALRARQALMARPSDKSLPYPFADHYMRLLVRDLMQAKAGTPSLSLARLARPAEKQNHGVPITQAWKEEFILWAFRAFQGRLPSEWTADQFNAHRPEQALSFLSGLRERTGGRPVLWLPAEEVAKAQELQALLAPREEVDATDSETLQQRISPYIKWLNQYALQEDEAYLLGSTQESAAERPMTAATSKQSRQNATRAEPETFET